MIPPLKKPNALGMPPPPIFTLTEEVDAYHSCSKDGECMSSGMLRKFRQCPAAYHLASTGHVEEKDSAAFRFGRAADSIILEGTEAFGKRYAIGGPINERTGKSFAVGTKAHDAWLVEKGYRHDQVINEDEAETLLTMSEAVREHPTASKYLEFGWPELVMRAEIHSVNCQIRMDWLTHDADGNYMIIDLKTTEDLYYFESDARRYGYLHQLAYYLSRCLNTSVQLSRKGGVFKQQVYDDPTARRLIVSLQELQHYPAKRSIEQLRVILRNRWGLECWLDAQSRTAHNLAAAQCHLYIEYAPDCVELPLWSCPGHQWDPAQNELLAQDFCATFDRRYPVVTVRTPEEIVIQLDGLYNAL